jgi:RND family efflux transporter MFP subunit
MASRALVGVLGLVVLLSLGGLAALHKKTPVVPEAGMPPRPAGDSVRSAPQSTPLERGFLGVIITDEAVDLATRIDGRVESVRVQVGSEVRKGDVVATLEAKTSQQELAIAEAELLSRRAEEQVSALSLEEAAERLRRRDAPNQLSTGALSEEELSAVRYQHRMAAAKLEIARGRVQEQEARVAQLRQRVTETSVRAPFDGVVASRLVHPGALVQGGQPLLHLLRRGIPQVRFAVPSSQVQHLTLGNRVRVEVPEQGVVLEGRVTQVAPEVDVASLMVFALADLETRDSLVPAGTAVRVKMVAEQQQVGRE